MRGRKIKKERDNDVKGERESGGVKGRGEGEERGWGVGAAVQRREVFNWRVTLGARRVSSSPSITRGREAPEVMQARAPPPPPLPPDATTSRRI